MWRRQPVDPIAGSAELTKQAEAAELVRRIVGGDGAAETEMVQHYWRGVHAVVRHATRSASIVDDLCQETFRIAIEKIRDGEIRQPAQLGAFMAALARNLATSHYRRASAQSGLVERFVAPSDHSGASADQLERILVAEKCQVVRQVLADLPSTRDREILRRYYLAEDEKARICADLGITSLHFNRVLFRARERFRALYVPRRDAPHQPPRDGS